MIKQFIPQEVCLKCQGCCRFVQENSAWIPCLLEEEIQGLLDKKNLPATNISAERKIQPISNPMQDGFICAFFNVQDNKCKIYNLCPFECQLYPFLINLRGKKVILTVDLNCPYIKDHIKSQEFRDYTEYLVAFLNSPAQIEILTSNPQILQAYEEVLDLIELRNLDGTK